MTRTVDKSFLSRWSRRKRGGARDDPPAAEETAAQSAVKETSPGDTDESDEAVLARLELPDPDTLAPGDDFSRFMAAAVPEHLRRRALRRLWRSNPALAVLDGLNDYDEDYSGGFVSPGSLKTAYEVGRGIISRTADATQATDFEATNAPDNNTREFEGPIDAAEGYRERGAQSGEEPPESTDNSREEDMPPVATRRRMQFRIAQKE